MVYSLKVINMKTCKDYPTIWLLRYASPLAHTDGNIGPTRKLRVIFVINQGSVLQRNLPAVKMKGAARISVDPIRRARSRPLHLSHLLRDERERVAVTVVPKI